MSLTDYRRAAIRATKVLYKDQARDKYILARNRRLQLSSTASASQGCVLDCMLLMRTFRSGC